jgi:DNA-binding NarL/FixJ family response regulator
MRCILVDDSPDFLASAARMLEAQGAEVVGLASTGEDALHMVETRHPDVVLVDVELGEEDGVALAERLRERAPASNAILISAYERDEILELIAHAPSAKFLHKSSLSASAIEALVSH